jgi:hypothetical protein
MHVLDNRYLEDDYFTHCPPSNVTSGFASLPVQYIYTNGIPGKPTTKRLPDGEEFDGKAAYSILLSYFTTYNITPEEVDQLAEQKLNELFPQVRYEMVLYGIAEGGMGGIRKGV